MEVCCGGNRDVDSFPTLAQAAQNNTVPTETQERLAQNDDDNPWDLLGLLGFLGLLGLRKKHPEDSYRPAKID